MNNKGKHLGKLIKQARTSLGISQQKLGSSIAGDYHTRASQLISNCERGKASLSPKYFVKLLQILEIDKKVLLEAYIQDYTDTILEVIKSYEKIQNKRLPEV